MIILGVIILVAVVIVLSAVMISSDVSQMEDIYPQFKSKSPRRLSRLEVSED